VELALSGRVALVTGGASGIGAATARLLAQEGCRVAVADRDLPAVTERAAELRVEGAEAEPVALDVGDAEAVLARMAETQARLGGLDILVNSAGLLGTDPVLDAKPDEWERLQRVNLAGVVHCSRAAARIMLRRGWGQIINIASVAAMRGGGSVGSVLYGTTKAGVVAFTMGLARELGPHGITVNAVAPSLGETPMTRQAITDDIRRRTLDRIPRRRLLDPSDVAALVAFLASERAAYITGTVIPVDGGLLTT
jgi:3-oxoacyl-[acyl-carrier protein] reductase